MDSTVMVASHMAVADSLIFSTMLGLIVTITE